jgi:hypothetical protein
MILTTSIISYSNTNIPVHHNRDCYDTHMSTPLAIYLLLQTSICCAAVYRKDFDAAVLWVMSWEFVNSEIST